MSVFISKTAQAPYELVEVLDPDVNTVTLSEVSGIDVLTIQSKMYLISTENRNQVEIRVENETLTGISVFISLLDIMENPLGWSKKIVLTDVVVEEEEETVVFPFMVEWRIINNLYIIKASEANVNLNVYGE